MLKNKNIEKKFKIALVCHSLSEGGLERVVSNISYMFEKMGMQVHLHVMQDEIGYPFAGKLYQYNMNKFLGIKNFKKYLELKKNIRINNYDLIIDHRYRLNPFIEVFWQKFIYNKQKVVNYIHSSEIKHYFSSLNKKLVNFIFRKRLFISVSKGIEKKSIKFFPLQRVETIYNPIILAESGIEPDIKKYIVTIARMDSKNTKQVDVLLECYKKSELPEKQIKLIIIGSGEKLEYIKQLANSLELTEMVLFTKFLENPFSYLQNALFTTLTSKYEGLPTVLIESLMLGTPVVSFNCETGPNEIIINEENGLLVEDQNKEDFIKAMNRMVNDKELYTKLKSNSKKSAEKFSEKQIIHEWGHFIKNKILNDKY